MSEPAITDRQVEAAAKAFSGAPFPSRNTITRARSALVAARGVEAPIAWRVKDFADGWILCHTHEQAKREAESGGNLIEALYR